MDDNTKDQLMYEEAVKEVQETVRKMREDGADFTSKAAKAAFRKKLIDTMKRIASDKRIFE